MSVPDASMRSDIGVRGVTVLGGHDGFDMRTCDRVVIEDCVFMSGDDCIAGFDNIDVEVRRCYFESACSIFRFGGNNVLIEDCKGTAATKYGFRKGLSDEKKISGAPTDENCRYNCRTVFLYYCDWRARIRKTPGNILIRRCSFDGVDAILNLPFGHMWCCNVSLSEIRFEDCTFENLHTPLNIEAPDKEPLELTLSRCGVSFAEDYGSAPFIRAKGAGCVTLDGVDIKGDAVPVMEKTQNFDLKISGTREVEIADYPKQ